MSFYGGQSTKITFDDSTLPTGSGDTIMYDTSVVWTGKNQFARGGIRKIVLDIVHDQAAELRLHKSSDRFVANDVQVSATVLAAGTTQAEFLVETYDDFRVVWENGGIDQGQWEVDMALSDDRAQP